MLGVLRSTALDRFGWMARVRCSCALLILGRYREGEVVCPRSLAYRISIGGASPASRDLALWGGGMV